MVKRGKIIRKVLLSTFLWAVLGVMYLPLLLLVVFSFSKSRTISLDGFEPGLELWKNMFQSSAMMGALFNTLVIATISAALATIIGTMACVGIMNMKRRTQSAIMNVNNIAFINADIVTSFSLVILFVTVGAFVPGFGRLVLAHTLISLPIVVLTILPRLKQLDKDLYDAAVDLGARPMSAFWGVVVPQLFSAMVGAFLLGFTLSLDDFIVTQYNKGGVETISTLVYNATRMGVPPEFRALSALVFGVVILVLIIYNLRTRKKGGKKHVDN